MTFKGMTFGMLTILGGVGLLMSKPEPSKNIGNAHRAEKQGWIEVRLEGSGREMGYQHGWLLAPEIDDALKVTKLSMTHGGKRDWNFYREAAKSVLWPRVSVEYREELEGIVEGLTARGVKADVWDIVAHNGQLELGYYTAWLDKQPGKSSPSGAPDRCSAFVATGSMTKDGRVVIGHNNWSGYLEGARWNIIFDIHPKSGYRILMDGYPGFIHSGDDFGVTSAGIAITETTITGFHGFDPNGVPEFVRAREAMQYASTLDEFADRMKKGNNGGYANTWLVADVKRNEIGRLELGLKHVTWDKLKDGYFVGANFPIDPKLAAEESDFDLKNGGLSPNARRVRWEQLMVEWKGKIDVAAGKQFLGDHHDAFEGKANSPSERTLCGHNEVSPRGMRPWQEPFGPAGAVQGKIADAQMVEQLEMDAVMGHPCGTAFKANQHMKKYPQFAWMKPLLKDMPTLGWANFKSK